MTSLNTVGRAELSFIINRAPSVGFCEAEPQEGYVLQTLFSVYCWDFSDSDKPLTYSFAYLSSDRKTSTRKDKICVIYFKCYQGS